MTRLIINNSFLNEMTSKILCRKPNLLKSWIVMSIVAVALLIYAIESLFINLFHGNKTKFEITKGNANGKNLSNEEPLRLFGQ